MTNIIDKLLRYDRINAVDIGHHKGNWAESFADKIPKDKFLYVLGVDPIDHGSTWNNKFIQKAISTKTGKRKFFTYSEPGCNSLNEMILENKFHRPQAIAKESEIEVDCVTLESVLDEFNFDLIHYLKVDAQGNDLDVIKSAGLWLNECMFVQMETCVSKHHDMMMYKNQNTRAEDIDYMKERGFELIDEWDHSAVSCPEADLIFFNTRYAD